MTNENIMDAKDKASLLSDLDYASRIAKVQSTLLRVECRDMHSV